MTDIARLRCTWAGPLVTFQDHGRHGRLRFGVPASGPMDTFAFAAANASLGNRPDDTTIEVSRGGLKLECLSGSVTLAVAGGGFAVTLDGRALDSWTVVTLSLGDTLSIQSGEWGSWAYLAIAGQPHVESWLGSTSTHSISGQGGGFIAQGQELVISEARTSPELDGELPVPPWVAPAEVVRVVMGPQLQRFVDVAATTFIELPFTLTDDYDRMGARLSGPELSLQDALAIPSEPIVRGSVQVSGDGVPTVLLADHQTTGGYPKIATVLSSDLDNFVQNRPGDVVRFLAVTPAEALGITRERSERVAEILRVISSSERTLSQRLMRNNLISWGQPDPSDFRG